jgi:hypothetical protein
LLFVIGHKNVPTSVSYESGGKAELTNPSVVHLRDMGSNLSTDKKYVLILFVMNLNLNL